MLPLIFEIPAGPVSEALLERFWGIASRYPGEAGRAIWERPTDIGIRRVILEVPERRPVYEAALATLTAIDYHCRSRWPFPPLLESHVVYHAEPLGSEVWASTPALFARGRADCEDLACDLAAEMQLQGVAARAELKLEEKTPTGDRWHVIDRLPDGRIIDPSALLGM